MSYKEVILGLVGASNEYSPDELAKFAKFLNGRTGSELAAIVRASLVLSDTTIYGLGNIKKFASVRRTGEMQCIGPESVGEGILKNLVHIGTPTAGSDSTNGDYSIYQTGTTANTKVGVRLPIANLFRLRRNLRLKFKFSISATSLQNDVRLYCGFDTASTFPTTDTPLATTDKGVVFGKAAGDTVFKIFNNDGAGTAEIKTDALGGAGSPPPTVPVDSALHHIEFQSDQTNARFLYSLDDGEYQPIETRIPGQDDQLYLRITAQNATASNVILNLYYIEAEIASGADLPWTNPPPQAGSGGLNDTTENLSNKTLSVDLNTINDSATNLLGDILVNNGTQYGRRAKGTASQVLHVKDDGTDLEWTDPSSTWNASGVETITNKTISASSNIITDIAAAVGDILKYNGTKFVRLARGTTGQVLTSGASDLSWATPAGGGSSWSPSATETLTNKTINGPDNTLTNIAKSSIPATTVYTDQANTWGLFDQLFKTSRLKLQNPAATFNYILSTSAITADRTVTVPLLTASDQLTFDAFATTLTNKTISGASNTLSNIPKSAIPAAAAYTDQSNTFGAFDQIFPTSRLKLQNPAATFNYILAASAITASRTVTLPLLTADDTIAMAGFGNAFTGTNIFANNSLNINNPAATFKYIFTSAAITADRTATLPLLTGNDTFVMAAFAQTLTNKTLTSPTIASILNTGTLTLPTSTDTLVGRATTDTLTNKTIDYNSNTIQNLPGGTSTLPDSGNKIGYFLGGTAAASGSSGSGLWNGLTMLGTSPLNVVDATASTGVVTKFAPAASNGSFSGFRMPNNYTRRDYNPVFKFKFAIGATTSRRVYFGFATTATNLPTGTDAVLASAESGFLFGYRSTADTNFMIFNNDASGAMVATSTGTAVDTAIHTVVLTADNTNTRFQWSIDGGAATNVTTRIPAATTTMNTYVQIENLSTGGPSIMLGWAQIVQQA